MNLQQQQLSWNKKFTIVIHSILFFIFSSILYFIISQAFKVVRSPYQVSAYHWEFPYHFIGVFSICFLVNLFFFRNSILINKKKYIMYFIFYGVWIITSLLFSGLLWSYFDMSAGYFPETSQLFTKIVMDMFYGLIWGGKIILFSFPYNLLLLVLSFFLIKNIRKIKMKVN